MADGDNTAEPSADRSSGWSTWLTTAR